MPPIEILLLAVAFVCATHAFAFGLDDEARDIYLNDQEDGLRAIQRNQKEILRQMNADRESRETDEAFRCWGKPHCH